MCRFRFFFFWFIFKYSESQLQIIKSTYRYLFFRRRIKKINHDIVWIPPSKSNTEYLQNKVVFYYFLILQGKYVKNVCENQKYFLKYFCCPTFLKWCRVSGLFSHISVMRHTAVNKTPWFFSFSKERVAGINISIRSGTLRMMQKAHRIAWKKVVHS